MLRGAAIWAAAWVRAAVVATLVGVSATTAFAHGQPVELPFWGSFPPDAARCQRVLSRATSVCIAQVAQARGTCLGSTVGGGTCDETALDAAVSAARQRALDRLERACTVPQLQNLGYVDLQDAQRDVTDACRQLDTAAVSAAFAPAMVGGTVAAVDETTAACVQAGARESTRLLRYAMRSYQQALDRIAGSVLTPDEKTRLVDWARARIARAQSSSAGALTAACPAHDFSAAYGRDVAAYLSGIAAQAGCMAGFVYVQDAVVCPAPACGNGMQERGEECDDGDDFDGDGCRGDCVRTECDAFATTYDLIQRALFENKGCTNDACHGTAQSGGLDLRAGASYDQLIDVPSSIDPTRRRIEPGDPQRSLLFLKLAAKTLPDEYPFEELGIGTPMPLGNAPGLSTDELEAMRQWIYAAATETGSVPGVGSLLDACLPEPEPITIRPLDPPAPAEGVQLEMPPRTIVANHEEEVCFGSYFDFTEQVPAEMRGPGDTFCYNTEQLRQDPLSHHLILYLYAGEGGPDDPAWGGFTCAGGPTQGASCDPTVKDACGSGGFCITRIENSVACTGFGPPADGRTAFPFGGSQETNATSSFPDGAYRCIPLKGMIWWNSHAFNLTDRDGRLRAWVNFTFARPEDRLYSADGIFDTSAIFKMAVPAFQQQEVCNIHVLPRNANLFELSSHMHSRGKRWRTFRGEFTCQGQTDGQGNAPPCDPLSPTQCADGAACAAPDGRDPMSSLLYTNFLYNDPVQLRFDPPLVFTGNRAERSLTYCALYDNGFTDPTTVKRQSTSPPTPFGTSTCPVATHCYSGNRGAACTGSGEARHRSCDSSPGAGDGLCDACTLRGGVTTQDEMFLLLGTYFVAP
jgi:cysteine-rich repeat protein